jgi:hypothetical protein
MMNRPVRAYWIFPPLVNGKCLDEGKVMLGGGVVNSASDLLTTVLPIPIVMRLQMPLKQRIGVCILLCLGMIVTIAGAIRTYFSWKSLIASYDETWFAYPLWIAAAVELDLGLVSVDLRPMDFIAYDMIGVFLCTGLEDIAATTN